jgi:hypothetical protein
MVRYTTAHKHSHDHTLTHSHSHTRTTASIPVLPLAPPPHMQEYGELHWSTGTVAVGTRILKSALVCI